MKKYMTKRTIRNNFEVTVFVSLFVFMVIRKGNINFFCWTYMPTHSSASVQEHHPEALPDHHPLSLEVTIILSLMVITSLVLFLLEVINKKATHGEINKTEVYKVNISHSSQHLPSSQGQQSVTRRQCPYITADPELSAVTTQSRPIQ